MSASPATRSLTDKFTPRAKRALHLAEQEAQRLRLPTPGTQHLLLGLVREGDGVAAQVLAHHGIELQKTRAAVASAGASLTAAGASVANAEVAVANAEPSAATQSPGRTFELAVERAVLEAQRFGHSYVGTEHLLLALLQEENGAALAVLRGLGADSGSIDAEVRAVVSLAPGTYVIRGPKDNVVTCRVDDAALNAIDALVEAGIRSTRSDAAAWLIGAGIEANRDFFAQVHSTVAEIRRLREKAQALARRGPETADA